MALGASDGEGGGEPPDEGFSHLAVSRRPTDMLITKTARILSGGFKTQGRGVLGRLGTAGSALSLFF